MNGLTLNSPFEIIDNILSNAPDDLNGILVDFHAEATSEKIALGYYADGRVSCVVGTHTHVQTNDDKILERGTAYITDVGMTGPSEGVIGVEKEIILEKFTKQIPIGNRLANGMNILDAISLEVDENTKQAISIEKIERVYEDLRRKKWYMGIIVALIVAIDQVTKYITRMNIDEFEKIKLIKNFFYLTYVKNTGAAWSLLEGKRLFFIILTTILIIGIIIYIFKTKNTLLRFIASVILSGAIGNYIDRLFIGNVTDFLDFYIFGYNFPVFNVADMAVVIGSFLLIFYILIIEGKNKNES